MSAKPRLPLVGWTVGWILLLAGGALGHLVQTSGGVAVEDVRFEFEPGKRLAALLYKPANATPATPAPGVLAVHGYLNSRETQSGFAIELARRGYVVLAIDQTGHGFSEGAAFSAGFGGPAALRYLRSLPFVDPDNVALEGHSMGGWTALAAAADQPDGYRSMVLVGSSTGPGFAPLGTPRFPRNLAVIFSRYDEFSQLMWGVGDAADVVHSDKLQGVFGTDQAIEPRRVYGSIAAGDARWLTMPGTTHPGNHLSRATIADTLDWISRTLEGGGQRSAADQIWFWKELGTLLALIGGVCIVLGGLQLLLRMKLFHTRLVRVEGAAPRDAAAQGAVERADAAWWLGLLAMTAIPALSYYPLTGLGAAFTANALFPQGVTNQILLWALVNGLIALLLGALLRRRRSRTGAAAAAGPAIGLVLSGLAALLAVLGLYLAVLLSAWLFNTDLRFWVVALKPMAPHHVAAFFAYLIPFTAFFYVSQQRWHATMALRSGALAQYASGIAASVAGLLVMVAVIYAYLFVAGHLPGVDPLFTIVALQFVVILTTTAVISVFAWRRTGDGAVGAMICGLLVTWYIVAGQATHV